MLQHLTSRTISLMIFLVIFAVVTRLYNITAPVNDRHSFRQTDTLALVQNFSLSGGDILRPQFFQTPNPSNINAYYFGEFPLYEYFLFLLFKITGESIVVARLVSIAMMSVCTLALFYIGRRFFDEKVGFAAAILFNLFPTSLFWGRALSPDVFALMCFMVSSAILCYKTKGSSYWLASLLFALAVLTKPFYFAFGLFHLAIFIYDSMRLELENDRSRFVYVIRKLGLFYLLPVLSYIAWRFWAGSFPDYTVDPDVPSILHDRKGWWQFWHSSDWITQLWYQRIMGELFTPLGGLLSIMGSTLIIRNHRRLRWHITFLIAGCLAIAYGVAWASRAHDYYLLMFLPVGALTAGYALDSFLSGFKRLLQSPNWLDKIGVLVTVCLVGFLGYFLGVEKFVSYTKAYFHTDPYDLYSQSFQLDYAVMKTIIPDDATVVMIQEQYSPVAVNYIKKRGNIYAVDPLKDCPSQQQFFTDLNHLRNLKASYVFIKKNYPTEQKCPRSRLQGWLDDRYPKVFTGQEFDGYQFIEPTLEIYPATDGSVMLKVRGVGSTAALEIGGIPGSVGPDIMTPYWFSEGNYTYTASVANTTQWLSFKLFWESPTIKNQHPEWVLNQDGFLVRR